MQLNEFVQDICPTTTQQWIKDGALLVDVREDYEIAELAFDVPLIMHIPFSSFDERYSEIPKDQTIVVVCQHGVRSLQAAAFLKLNGYDNVVNMKHGMKRWVERGFSVKGNVNSVLGTSTSSGCGCGTSTHSEGESSCCSTDSNNSGGCC